MGAGVSRIDRFYVNYEKSFERIEKDVRAAAVRRSTRAARRARLSRATGAIVVAVVAVALGIIYHTQRLPPGFLSYQEHLMRVGGALAAPAAAVAAHWLLGALLALLESRDERRLRALEAAKRAMVKELKDMSRYDKIKSLLDKFDPDARPFPPAAAVMAGYERGRPEHLGYLRAGGMAPGVPGGRAAAAPAAGAGGMPPAVPALLVKGSGQVAGAAALAVAGAGRALVPLFDRLATTLISDNPMLVADLRRAQEQLTDAEARALGAAQEVSGVRLENLALKQRVLELEQQLGLPPSYDAESLAEALASQQAAAVQLPWAVQQMVTGSEPGSFEQLGSGGSKQGDDAAGSAGIGEETAGATTYDENVDTPSLTRPPDQQETATGDDGSGLRQRKRA